MLKQIGAIILVLGSIGACGLESPPDEAEVASEALARVPALGGRSPIVPDAICGPITKYWPSYAETEMVCTPPNHAHFCYPITVNESVVCSQDFDDVCYANDFRFACSASAPGYPPHAVSMPTVGTPYSCAESCNLVGKCPCTYHG